MTASDKKIILSGFRQNRKDSSKYRIKNPIPIMDKPPDLQSYLNLLQKSQNQDNPGNTATYIPELETVDPSQLGVCLVTTSGEVIGSGEYLSPFTIQSICKPIIYGLALEMHGRERVGQKVGSESSGCAFNALCFDEYHQRPYNPMVNTGAIATTDLIEPQQSLKERLQVVLETLSLYTNRTHAINEAVCQSETQTGNRNRAMGYWMMNLGMISDRLEETLTLYFHQCSIEVTCQDLAMIACTLGNGGINPITGKRALASEYIPDVLNILYGCGMYDASGKWGADVGLPGKSGVSGGILAVAPKQLGIGTFSPRIDRQGNSVRGIRLCRQISHDLGLHLFKAS